MGASSRGAIIGSDKMLKTVRVKQECSACPFDGGCKQCGGKGWCEVNQTVNVTDADNVKVLKAALVEATQYIYINCKDSDELVSRLMRVIRGN